MRQRKKHGKGGQKKGQTDTHSSTRGATQCFKMPGLNPIMGLRGTSGRVATTAAARMFRDSLRREAWVLAVGASRALALVIEANGLDSYTPIAQVLDVSFNAILLGASCMVISATT